MHTVYADVLAAVNIFIDFMLLVCTAKLLSIKTKFIRLVLGSLLGGALSLTALLPEMNFFVNTAVSICGAAAMVSAAFGFGGAKLYVRRICVYFTVSFIFCGIMTAVYTAFRPKNMAIYNNVVYFDISPALLIILTLVCYYILRLIKRLTKGVCAKEVKNIEIVCGEKSCAFAAKTDTGCSLREPFSGYPVIIAERSLLGGIEVSEEKMRVIPFESLGGSGIIKGFRPDRVLIDGTERSSEIYVGICDGILKGEIKALAPPDAAE